MLCHALDWFGERGATMHTMRSASSTALQPALVGAINLAIRSACQVRAKEKPPDHSRGFACRLPVGNRANSCEPVPRSSVDRPQRRQGVVRSRVVAWSLPGPICPGHIPGHFFSGIGMHPTTCIANACSMYSFALVTSFPFWSLCKHRSDQELKQAWYSTYG